MFALLPTNKKKKKLKGFHTYDPIFFLAYKRKHSDIFSLEYFVNRRNEMYFSRFQLRFVTLPGDLFVVLLHKSGQDEHSQ